MRGKRLVNAIPTAALLAIRRCSASRTSGRRSSRVEGRPTGSDSGNFTSSGRMERCITCGYSPAKKAMSFSLTEILRSNSGTNVAVRAYSTSAPLGMTFALLEMTFVLLEMTSALREMLCSDVGGQFGGYGDDTLWRWDDSCRLVSDGTDARLVRCGHTFHTMRTHVPYDARRP